MNCNVRTLTYAGWVIVVAKLCAAAYSWSQGDTFLAGLSFAGAVLLGVLVSDNPS